MNESAPVADELVGIPNPCASTRVVGHSGVIEEILGRFREGRSHHAYLLAGPKGIGKSTLALRLSSHIFRYPNTENSPLSLAPAEPADPIDAKIAARSHPNLLHLQRPWDMKLKRFRQNLTVDEIRKTIPFFGASRGEAGWRVGIIDSVDDMNKSASNALLKILEEPPERTIFFVLSNSPASVLPTIRSRCQYVAMKPLSHEEVLELLNKFGVTNEIDPKDRPLLAELARGSVRDGITLSMDNGLDLYKSFASACDDIAKPDWTSIHALADMVTGKGGENRFRLLLGFAERYMEEQATGKGDAGGSISVLARWAEVWEKTRNSVRTAEAYNLDRKQIILNLFQDMGHAARV